MSSVFNFYMGGAACMLEPLLILSIFFTIVAVVSKKKGREGGREGGREE
jgi:hypothetical protein